MIIIVILIFLFWVKNISKVINEADEYFNKIKLLIFWLLFFIAFVAELYVNVVGTLVVQCLWLILTITYIAYPLYFLSWCTDFKNLSRVSRKEWSVIIRMVAGVVLIAKIQCFNGLSSAFEPLQFINMTIYGGLVVGEGMRLLLIFLGVIYSVSHPTIGVFGGDHPYDRNIRLYNPKGSKRMAYICLIFGVLILLERFYE